MNSRLLAFAVVAALILVIAVPLEYVVVDAGLMSGGQAAAAWGVGIGLAIAFAAVYLWRGHAR